MAEVYADSTCEKPSLTATLEYVADANTGKILDMDNLRTGGEGEPITFSLHYKVKFTGKTDIPYPIRFTVNGVNFGRSFGQMSFNLSDTVYIEGNLNMIYRQLYAVYGITTFTFGIEYQIPGDTEWQPLNRNRP